MTTNTQPNQYEDKELREEMEDISCEYGRPHEDTCDLNSEDGAIDGCTCSVGELLDEIAEKLALKITQLITQKQLEACQDENKRWQALLLARKAVNSTTPINVIDLEKRNVELTKQEGKDE